MQVRSIRDGIPEVDSDPKPDRPIRWLIAVVDWNSLLHLDSAPHRTVDAVEDDEQRVAASLDDAATMLPDDRVYQVLTQSP